MNINPGRLKLNRVKRGGGWSVITGWGRATLSRRGKRLWQILNHKSACLSCAWGTGGQNGGFRDELGEPLQRCIKSVEAIRSELQSAVPRSIFDCKSLTELQQLDSSSCDQLGRLDRPLIKKIGQDYYEPISWGRFTRFSPMPLRRVPLSVWLLIALVVLPMKRLTFFSC